MVSVSVPKKVAADAPFRHSTAAKGYFERRDRSRATDVHDVNYVRAIAWNADGTSLYSGSDKTVSVFSLDGSSKLRFTATGTGHEDNVDSIAASKVSKDVFASCSADKSVRIWDSRSLKSTTKIPTKDSNLFVAYTPDDKYVIVSDKSDNVSVIDVRAGKVSDNVSFKEETNDIVVHSSGQFAFVGTSGGKVEVLTLPDLKKVKAIKAHPTLSSCQALCLSPNERFLSVGASDACCSIWDLDTGTCVRMLQRLDYPIRSVSYSHCGGLLASGSEDHFIDVAWAETGEKVIDVPLVSECYSVAWHPLFYLLAYVTAPERDHRDHSQATIRVFGYNN